MQLNFIEMEKGLKSLGYKLNERKFSDIKPLFSEDYRSLTFFNSDNSIAYYGLESIRVPKLPNLTVISNLHAKQGAVFGSTMGHQHNGGSTDSRFAQEVYEFHGDGAILLRENGVVKLHILEAGDKAIISPRENMTLFNLGKEELHLLDYADPARNPANKDLEKRIGPLLLISLCPQSVISCRVNAQYLEEGLITRLRKGHVEFKYDSSLSVKENFARHSEEFRQEGIDLVIGGNLSRDYVGLDKPLLDLVLLRNRSLQDLLGLDS